MSKILSLGKNFFSNEKRAYNNWKEAILKEILQNGLDSPGCTRMDFDFIKNEQTTKIIAKDNGAGMTLKTLENVFLVLGESKKEGWNPIGGFGVARQLITFAMESYVIKSFNYICRGSGAMYDVEQTKETFRGCIFEIETEHHDWENELKNLLNKSSVNAAVYINGIRYSNILHKGRKARDLSFGELYINKSAAPGLYVRVSGLLMFSKWVNCKAQVCLEVCPEKSKQVLTSNRYGLQYKESAELDEFLNELAANTKSALKDKTRHFTKFVNKETYFTSRPKTTVKQNLNNQSGSPEISEDFVKFDELIEKLQKERTIKSFGANPIDEQYLPNYIKCPILSSMIILNESNDPKTVQLIKNFYMPEKWENRAATRYQLIRVWHAIVEIVMDELSNYVKQEFSYAVGFNFNDYDSEESETLAMHLKSDGVHYLMFNPIDETNKLKYSVNCVDDYFDLIVLACHEATHCIFTAHNEDFSSFFTLFLQKVLNKRKEIVAAAKEAKD